MAITTASAHLALSYPIYAVDFDPQDSDFLLVGGGGGEGRSGVGNKITLLDASRNSKIVELVEINLGREEDNCQSLAYTRSTSSFATIFAGINSSEADHRAGKNEHLRSFRIDYPLKRKKVATEKEGTTVIGDGTPRKLESQAISKVGLFKPSDNDPPETYQRRIRISIAGQSHAPVGVISTSLAPEEEIVVFDASTDRPDGSSVRGKITLGKKQEVADIDIIEQSEQRNHRVAYCTNHDVYVYDVPWDKSPSDPLFLYTVPHPDVFEAAKTRPTYRSLRLLTPNLILLLQNRPNTAGPELHLLEVSDSGMSSNIILRKKLPRHIKQGTNLAASLLPASGSSSVVQHVIAVSGKDCSIHILTLTHDPSKLPSSRLKFQPYTVFRNTHPLEITALVFSTFIPPQPDSQESATTNTRPKQPVLKLASGSFGNTVVVYTFPLTALPSNSSRTASEKAPQVKRYVLQTPSESISQNTFSIFMAALVIALGAFFLQAFTEIRGGTPEFLGAKGWLSKGLHNTFARPYMFENATIEAPVVVSSMPALEDVRKVWQEAHEGAEDMGERIGEGVEMAQLKLRDLLAKRKTSAAFSGQSKEVAETSTDETDLIIVQDTGPSLAVSTAVVPPGTTKSDEVVKVHKKWEELTEDQKRRWKRRLVDAGEWAVEEGESVLKGVVFGQIGGIVGGVVADAL
ncbi:hypothetical protein MMC25_000546 [Agyrium rufum]|nr:hypothetical protein [Agyrium rufum]